MAAYYPSTTQAGRWYVSSEWNGPNKAQAKAMGLMLKRNGRLRRYYDAQGTLRMAYSYNTCILAWTAPSEDYPQGRAVLNLTRYSMTSNRHQGEIIGEVVHQGGGDGYYAWWRFAYTLKNAPQVLLSAMDLAEIPEESTHTDLLSAATREAMHVSIEQAHWSEMHERLEKRAAKREARRATVEDRLNANMRAVGLTLIQGGVK